MNPMTCDACGKALIDHMIEVERATKQVVANTTRSGMEIHADEVGLQWSPFESTRSLAFRICVDSQNRRGCVDIPLPMPQGGLFHWIKRLFGR